MVINRITRSPFGALIHQTNDDVWLPFGFQGAVEEPTSGATIFNGNDGIPPYDSHIGQVDHLHMFYFFIFLYLLYHGYIFTIIRVSQLIHLISVSCSLYESHDKTIISEQQVWAAAKSRRLFVSVSFF